MGTGVSFPTAGAQGFKGKGEQLFNADSQHNPGHKAEQGAGILNIFKQVIT